MCDEVSCSYLYIFLALLGFLVFRRRMVRLMVDIAFTADALFRLLRPSPLMVGIFVYPLCTLFLTALVSR